MLDIYQNKKNRKGSKGFLEAQVQLTLEIKFSFGYVLNTIIGVELACLETKFMGQPEAKLQLKLRKKLFFFILIEQRNNGLVFWQ